MELTMTQWLLVGLGIYSLVGTFLLIFVGRELLTKIKIALNRGKIIKVIMYTPSKSVRTMYTKLDDIGMIRSTGGEPFTVDKDFFFMDEKYAVPTITYREDHPAPIDPLEIKASKIDPSLIEGLLFRVQAYTQRKATKDMSYVFYTLIVSALTLVAVIIAAYILHSDHSLLLKGASAAVHAASHVVLR